MTGQLRPRPTNSELAVLQVLWERGPCTVRQVHEALRDERGTRYTTTLKIMQVMAEKGLVTRDDSRRSHIYRAAVDEEKTRCRVLSEFVDRAFGGSTRKLILHALSSGEVSPEEVRQIKRLLEKHRENDHDGD